MGIMKWLARKGAVGGTTRWAAKGYMALTNQDPNIEMGDLYEALIKNRYAVMPNPEKESILLSIVDQIKGLRGLVVSILTVEAGFLENTPDNQQMFIGIILEELKKYRVPKNVIQGNISPTDKTAGYWC